MYVGTDGCVDERTYGCIDGWMHGCMDACMCVSVYMYVCI